MHRKKYEYDKPRNLQPDSEMVSAREVVVHQ